MVNWDDKAVYDFLKDYGFHNMELEKRCIAASSSLVFLEVDKEDIVTKKYKIHPDRVRYWQLRHSKGKTIGTFFCRRTKEGKWFLKDGNHRYKALKDKEQTFRIAYDPKGRI